MPVVELSTVGVFVAFYHHLQVQAGNVVTGVKIMNEILGQGLFDCTTGEAAAADFAGLRELLNDGDFWKRMAEAPLHFDHADRDPDSS